MLKKVVGWALWLVMVVCCGVTLANVLIITPPIRKAFKVPAETPSLFSGWVRTGEEKATTQARPSPTEGDNAEPNASPSPRMSWGLLEHQPSDPKADPTNGRTELISGEWLGDAQRKGHQFSQQRETRLSARLAKLPLPILRLGLMQTGLRGIGFVEFWCGKPARRPQIEQTAARIIDIAFSSDPQISEISAVAVPWRTVKASKAPQFFSVLARRNCWAHIAGWLPAQQLYDQCGAVWYDPRVLPD